VNQENCKAVQAAVAEAGDYLKERLPAHPEHKERNAYAHLWRCIKEAMGRTYKECDDADLPRVLEIVKRERESY
jgi:hypothetical protein